MAEPNPPAAASAALHVQDDDTPRANDRFERALFDSARADEVPKQARARVALALGVALPPGGALPSGATQPSRADEPSSTEEMMRAPSEGRVAGVSSPGAAAADGAGVVDGVGAVASGGELPFAGKCALVALAGGLAALLALGHSDGASVHQPAAPALAALPDGRQSATSALPASAFAHPPAVAAIAAPDGSERPRSALLAGAPADGSAAPTIAAPPDEPAPSAPIPSVDSRAATAPEPRDARSARTAARLRQRAPRAPEAAGESRLLAEVARLDQARVALAASDAQRVLQHVERYRAEFPNGVLAREAARLEARGRALEGGSTAPRRDIERGR